MLQIKPIIYCARCEKVLLEECEINVNEEELNSIQCNLCNAWFHYSCENIKASDFNCDDGANWMCFACLVSTTT